MVDEWAEIDNAFRRAAAEQMQRLIEDLARAEDAALVRDGRRYFTNLVPKPHQPCPANIGNDPCDDWSEPDWEDYDA